MTRPKEMIRAIQRIMACLLVGLMLGLKGGRNRVNILSEGGEIRAEKAY